MSARVWDRFKGWHSLFGFWTLLVLVYATRTEILGHPLTPIEALKMSIARWYVWGALAYFIVAIDRRLPVKRNAPFQRLLLHVPISLVFIGIYTVLNYWVSRMIGANIAESVFSGGTLPVLTRAFLRPNNLVYWVILVAHLILEYEKDQKDQQIRTATLEALLSESRLKILRVQLHPHFLFNSLNTISAYVESDPAIARRMLEELGDLLRLALDNSDAQEIPLSEELAFLRRYLDLQKMKIDDRLEVTIRADTSVLQALVPTFILQPLAENAIRYGIAPRHDKGVIQIDAWQTDASLNLRVRDDGPGLPAGWDFHRAAGIGLSNTRERLRALYGESDQGFTIRPDPAGGVRVELRLPFRKEPVTPIPSEARGVDHPQ